MINVPMRDATREFDVLVRKAARDGFLDVQGLQSAYRALQPLFHPDANNDRRVDVEALTFILCQLPLEFANATRLMVVPSLQAFAHVPISSQGLRAGMLSDGMMLIEAAQGHRSLMTLAVLMAGLACEIDKAMGLLFEAAQVRRQRATEWDEPEQAPAPDTDPSLTHIAMDLGVDQQALVQANATTHGALFALLFERDTALPEVDIHAELQPAWRSKRMATTADKLVQALAERGLLQRPIVVWVSPIPLADNLSPFVRDLREPLWAWAQEGPEELGHDLLPLPEQPNEDLLACIAHDFMMTDPAVHDERVQVDRSVGMHRHTIDGFDYSIIDTARIDPNACDVRLQPWGIASPAPVIIALPHEAVAQDSTLLDNLLHTVGSSIVGITVIQPATALDGTEGRIVAPTFTITWAGEDVTATPRIALLPAESFGVSSHAPLLAALLSVPCLEVLDHRHVHQLAKAWSVHAVVIENTPVYACLRDALWRGQLPNVAWIQCHAVTMHPPMAQGRAALPGIAACNGIAIATLRRLTQNAEPEVIPSGSVDQDSARSPKKSGRSADKKGNAPSRSDTGFRRPYAPPGGIKIKG